MQQAFQQQAAAQGPEGPQPPNYPPPAAAYAAAQPVAPRPAAASPEASPWDVPHRQAPAAAKASFMAGGPDASGQRLQPRPPAAAPLQAHMVPPAPAHPPPPTYPPPREDVGSARERGQNIQSAASFPRQVELLAGLPDPEVGRNRQHLGFFRAAAFGLRNVYKDVGRYNSQTWGKIR